MAHPVSTDNPMTFDGRTSMARWLPSLSFANTLTFAAMFLSLVLFKRLGLGNEEIATRTALLFTPWLLRPLLERFLPDTGDQRLRIVAMEAMQALLLMSLAFTMRSGVSTNAINALLWFTALCGTIHTTDTERLCRKGICSHHSAALTFRSLGFLVAMVYCQGFLVAFAGNMEVLSRTIRYSWSLTFYLLGGTFLLFAILHCVTLAIPDSKGHSLEDLTSSTKTDWIQVILILLTLLPEGMATLVGQQFLIDAKHNGGLGLSPSEYGLTQGTVGMVGIALGSIIGVITIRRYGCHRLLWPMAVALTIPLGLFCYLSHAMTGDILIVSLCLLARLLAFGFGITTVFRYLSTIQNDSSRSASLVFLTLIVVGLFSGLWQESMGYRSYFATILYVCPISFVAVGILKYLRTKR